MDLLQTITHYFLHFLAPGLIARFFFPDNWLKAWAIMLATMVIDLDHLIAVPLFDPDRCSIGFHPLHSYYVMPVYAAMLFFKKTRIVGAGLLFHLLTDFQDCLWMWHITCASCQG